MSDKKRNKKRTKGTSAPQIEEKSPFAKPTKRNKPSKTQKRDGAQKHRIGSPTIREHKNP